MEPLSRVGQVDGTGLPQTRGTRNQLIPNEVTLEFGTLTTNARNICLLSLFLRWVHTTQHSTAQATFAAVEQSFSVQKIFAEI